MENKTIGLRESWSVDEAEEKSKKIKWNRVETICLKDKIEFWIRLK